MPTSSTSTPANVVLVHGGFVDVSGWESVYRDLRRAGHAVTVVQNPTLSLADDVRVTQQAIASMQGPMLLVGHSYGGVVISEAGTIRGSWDSSTSLPSSPMRANRWQV